MAATFKSRLEPDLSDPGVSQSPDHHHYMNGYPCIKTNGSLVRSFSTEESEISGLNGGHTIDRDIDFDDCSPSLKDVEILLRGYSQSPFEHEEEHGQDIDDDDDFAENGSSPILLSECPEFQAYLQPFETSNVNNDIDEDEIVFGFKSHRNGNSSKDKREDEDALWELIEAETEALCLSEEGLVRLQSHNAPQSPGKFPLKVIPFVNIFASFALLRKCPMNFVDKTPT
ncbi:unnamed protein product [Rodentolepis nana]|uniref:Clathrin_bdg domain-containing protein n=1 Tax=Rodentolepis nana TaxID=102285 RepID=A0A0R3TD86_RODNA|nr:unnamed protein product [Rodentolepis nana]